MLQKKVCMLGSFAVGKTSLVRRYVESIFSEKYQTTIGVKVDKKQVCCQGETVNLMLWDMHGEDQFQRLQASYLRGAAGFLLVADGTRADTLTHALDIRKRTLKILGEIPFILLLNKADLTRQWQVNDQHTASLAANGCTIIETSAKTGAGVDQAFTQLTAGLLAAMLKRSSSTVP